MLAPWCVGESWKYLLADGVTEQAYPEGCKYAWVTGREPCPANLKANPLWWWRNDYEQDLAHATWFEPDKDQTTRERDWALRNPLQNARLFVWGCADKNYTVEVVEGHMNPMVVQRDDVGEQGYQRIRLFNFKDGSKERTFTSYCSSKVRWYWGTQPTGFYGVKFNLVR
ncbi:MAG: hypothetical protein C5B60_07070, partial [Chloroflexi bacterium]